MRLSLGRLVVHSCSVALPFLIPKVLSASFRIYGEAPLSGSVVMQRQILMVRVITRLSPKVRYRSHWGSSGPIVWIDGLGVLTNYFGDERFRLWSELGHTVFLSVGIFLGVSSFLELAWWPPLEDALVLSKGWITGSVEAHIQVSSLVQAAVLLFVAL